MVRRHRQTRGRRQDAHGTDPGTRADLDRQLVKWTPKSGRNRLLFDDRGAARLGAVAPARLGCAADLFREERGIADRPRLPAARPGRQRRIVDAFEAEGADAWYKPGAKARFLGNDHDPDAYEQVFDILDVWFDSGSTHAFVLRDRADGTRTASRISTWRAPTSIAAGSIPRCCRPAAPRARALSQRADPWLHAGREGQQDVQIAGQHHRARKRWSSNTAPISCGSGWRRRTTPPISASGRRS
jgi:hypothetical protein